MACRRSSQPAFLARYAPSDSCGEHLLPEWGCAGHPAAGPPKRFGNGKSSSSNDWLEITSWQGHVCVQQATINLPIKHHIFCNNHLHHLMNRHVRVMNRILGQIDQTKIDLLLCMPCPVSGCMRKQKTTKMVVISQFVAAPFTSSTDQFNTSLSLHLLRARALRTSHVLLRPIRAIATRCEQILRYAEVRAIGTYIYFMAMKVVLLFSSSFFFTIHLTVTSIGIANRPQKGATYPKHQLCPDCEQISSISPFVS
jgi:hypothetical protein